ncbi:IclR family transcriptional regulator [Nocardia sp. NEAU-G5]|uniref:IclR family transcriptional regulator n=1 Tax=Nocardia albiluteola TaxID=2842303 RepID=A0ABS6ASF7_9NOCA|nr:IclR family transcriptional regulator [Nocardia albiluteola]MBU3060963.1 IclR family transcriptional regulator [Nocardia albiluteola]
MARYSNGESVFSRLSRLLEAFEDDNPVITVSELSKRTGLSLPTVSRMVSELVDRGWLQRDADRRVWIGLRMWELVSRSAPTRDLVRVATPYMTELSARIGQNVHLSVRQGFEVMFIELLSAPHAVPTVLNGPGSRLPLHASAPGLVLLAYSASGLQEAVLSGPLPPLSPRTVTDPQALRALLSEIRRTGAAYCPGLIDPANTAIAVPVRSTGREVVAALSAIVPNTEAARAVVPMIRTTGAQISRALADRNTPKWQPDSGDSEGSEELRHNPGPPGRELRYGPAVFGSASVAANL